MRYRALWALVSVLTLCKCNSQPLHSNGILDIIVSVPLVATVSMQPVVPFQKQDRPGISLSERGLLQFPMKRFWSVSFLFFFITAEHNPLFFRFYFSHPHGVGRPAEYLDFSEVSLLKKDAV